MALIFYKPGALSVTQPAVLEHWRKQCKRNNLRVYIADTDVRRLSQAEATWRLQPTARCWTVAFQCTVCVDSSLYCAHTCVNFCL